MCWHLYRNMHISRHWQLDTSWWRFLHWDADYKGYQVCSTRGISRMSNMGEFIVQTTFTFDDSIVLYDPVNALYCGISRMSKYGWIVVQTTSFGNGNGILLYDPANEMHKYARLPMCILRTYNYSLSLVILN